MSDVLSNTFANIADNGNSAAFEMPGDVNDVDVYLADSPTYDSASITAQTSFDGGTTWVTTTMTAITTGDGYMRSFRCFGKNLRFVTASVAAAGADIDVTVVAKAVGSTVQNYNITANGNTEIPVSRPGDVAVFLKGTWDSASVTMTVSPDGTLYVDSGETAVTANGGFEYTNTPGNHLFRLVTASAAGVITDLDVQVYAVDA